MKGKFVRWECITCGNEWKGKSPHVRNSRPICPECSSRNVRVKDWLIDKERWEKARLNAFERAKWRCEACSKNLDISAPVHHLDYEDYYNPDDLICLCPQCHYLTHGDPYFKVGRVLRNVGLIATVGGTFVWWWVLPNSKLQNIVNLAVLSIIIGIGFIFLSYMLTQKTRKLRRKIKKVVKNRKKFGEPISGEDETIHSEEEEVFQCQECGRKISETEYWEFGGLCNRCRGMPLQQGFPAPPGFPKLR
jgi:Zn finger protein HypA/HybF involved in hydrogenase expression